MNTSESDLGKIEYFETEDLGDWEDGEWEKMVEVALKSWFEDSDGDEDLFEDVDLFENQSFS